MSIEKDCFAYKEENGRPMCHALHSLDCTNCRFYKHRKQIKNNPFYAFSYDDAKQLQYDIEEKNIKIKDVLWK